MVKNHHLAKSISDAGWGEFISMLEYKAGEAGTKLVKVNPSGTSQKCSRCGMTVPKELSERVHCCPYCGLTLDRDVNVPGYSEESTGSGSGLNASLPWGPRKVTPVELVR